MSSEKALLSFSIQKAVSLLKVFKVFSGFYILLWHCNSMNNLHYECVKHWNEVVSRNACINGITIRICFQNPCLHNIYNMQEHGCNYSNTSFSHGHMIQFCISCMSLIANAGLSYYVYIYIYISGIYIYIHIRIQLLKASQHNSPTANHTPGNK